MSVVTVNEYWENEVKKREGRQQISIQYATVVELTRDGYPIIQFVGDKLPSQKTYTVFDNIEFKIGQRIQLIDNVIQGGWSPR